MENPAIPTGALVLVTGANGFIGSHVADQILAAGYRVRGTSRDSTKAEWTSDYFQGKYGKDAFEGVVVKDMAEPGAFDGVMKGCAAVAHVASDMTFRPNPEEVIPPTVAGITNVLKAAAMHPSVKRFVLTSSSTAATLPKPGVKFHIDSSTWNDEAVEMAQKPPPYEASRAFPVYGASKTLAERAAWDFVKKELPGFALSTILPNFNIGRILIPARQIGSTAGWIKGLYEGDKNATESLRNFDPQYFVDVDDVARLHLAALVYDDVKGERLFGFTAPFNFNDLLAAMRRINPDKRLPDDLEDAKSDLSTVETGRSEELLRRMGMEGFTKLEDSIRECVLPYGVAPPGT